MVLRSALSCVVTSITFCFGAALSSLMGACCGNDKPSTVAPGAASGRKRSVLLLVLAIGIAIGFQYGIASYIVNVSFTNYVTSAWLDGCDLYETDALIEKCAGNAGVYRATFSALVFYCLATIAVVCKKTANREAWPAKYTLFLFMVAGMCFVPNEPLFSSIYLNIARVGAAFFILFDQIVMVDIAYNWNDGWVERSDKAEAEESGSGKKWLIAIIVSAASLFIASIVGWGLLFYYFGGCSTNTAFISITVILSIAVTSAQLTGTEGSLLASSLITAYATMLCYNAVSKNPNPECNPFLKTDDALSIAIGVSLAIIGLGYIGFSATADTTLSGTDDEDDEEAPKADASGEKAKVAGVVANYDTTEDKDEMGGEGLEKEVPNTFSNNWKLNIALASVSCWVAMALTGFGSIQADGDVANPQIGEVNMW
eukprot:CAMPEP_0116132290 /NCGR_PEP_ID=MMETSP0329-20121206/9467_1 /TAXON_ID=697910 /ORGANISM="Pseudo-nitzschia arenysensis, Strain B593" /LENGTH=426 /DNA_ID=CAMNT_0003626791 /DNA_START=160 /DNA_END=1437 /DNA_ORIENTATION=-